MKLSEVVPDIGDVEGADQLDALYQAISYLTTRWAELHGPDEANRPERESIGGEPAFAAALEAATRARLDFGLIIAVLIFAAGLTPATPVGGTVSAPPFQFRQQGARFEMVLSATRVE